MRILIAIFAMYSITAYADGIWSGGGVIGVDGINNKNAIGTDGITNVKATGGGGGCSNSFDFSQACNSQYLGGI